MLYLDILTIIVSLLSLVASIATPILVSIYNNKKIEKRQKNAFTFKKELLADHDSKLKKEAQLTSMKQYLQCAKNVIDDFYSDEKKQAFFLAKNDIFIHAPNYLWAQLNETNYAIQNLLDPTENTNPLYLQNLAMTQFQIIDEQFCDFFQSSSKNNTNS